MRQMNSLPAHVGQSWLQQLNDSWHDRALSVYMLIVFGHWAEHIAQAYQVYLLGWLPADAGGVLGLWFPQLARSEILHFVYNLAMLLGLMALRQGFQGRARTWWTAALVLQGWHFFEHVLLQLQWLSGFYFFGASQQTSLLQFWLPRVQLHLLYNSIVFAPMVVALYLHGKSHWTRTSNAR